MSRARAQGHGGHCFSRTGCAPPAVGSATAVTAGSAMAAAPPGSSFTWPSSTAITTLRNTWRGESFLQTLLSAIHFLSAPRERLRTVVFPVRTFPPELEFSAWHCQTNRGEAAERGGRSALRTLCSPSGAEQTALNSRAEFWSEARGCRVSSH